MGKEQMKSKQMKDEKQVIEYLQSRLNWCVYGSDSEYNEEEAKAISDLLQIMDPIEMENDFFGSDNAESRFWEYYEQETVKGKAAGAKGAMSFEDRLAAKQAEEQLKASRKWRPFVKYSTVAALAVALFLGGTVGAYAQKQGFFRKVDGGADKNSGIASPTVIGEEYYVTYNTIEEVPLKYLNCLWTPVGLPDDVSLYNVELSEKNIFIKTKCEFMSSNGKQFLNTTKKSFKDTVVITDQLYDGFEFYRSINYDSIDVQYMKKVNDDYREYVAVFFYEDRIYSIASNFEFEIIENIIKENIFNKNL